jgi:hypothetical protein
MIIFEVSQFDDFASLRTMAFPTKHICIGGDGSGISEVSHPNNRNFPNEGSPQKTEKIVR